MEYRTSQEHSDRWSGLALLASAIFVVLAYVVLAYVVLRVMTRQM